MSATARFSFEEIGQASYQSRGFLDHTHVALLTDSLAEPATDRNRLHFELNGLLVSVPLSDEDLGHLAGMIEHHRRNVQKAEAP